LLESCVLIPAIKKNVAFPDDVIKKLAGRTLLDRAIDKAITLVGKKNIIVLTDSEEISQHCAYKQIRCSYDKKMEFSFYSISITLNRDFGDEIQVYSCFVNLSIYAPLLDVTVIKDAVCYLKLSGKDFLQPVAPFRCPTFSYQRSCKDILFNKPKQEIHAVSGAFDIITKSALFKNESAQLAGVPYLLPNSLLEITNHRDWWVCEKIIKSKKIVFRVIGNPKVGFGHVYREMTIAHEISDHEVVFLCNKDDFQYLDVMVGKDYELYSVESDAVHDTLKKINPDCIVNDILDTSVMYMQGLKTLGIKSINFEDIGKGAVFADKLINALYSEESIIGALTGNDYFVLRDEFEGRKAAFRSVQNVLIIFGATDINNLTNRTLEHILPICQKNKITITIVTGPGYLYSNDLQKMIVQSDYKDDIQLISNSSTLASVFESADIAIASNGRTKLELFHCNVPTIVVSQHEREKKHNTKSCGYGIYMEHDQNDLFKLITAELEKLITYDDYRREQYDKLQACDYSRNKKRIISIIEGLLVHENKTFKSSCNHSSQDAFIATS
jgi:spore coat polysaccharide biosynthesis predicted glycosyltransferase SpsG/CMP-N-acetylneuraminic acid synthetase